MAFPVFDLPGLVHWHPLTVANEVALYPISSDGSYAGAFVARTGSIDFSDPIDLYRVELSTGATTLITAGSQGQPFGTGDTGSGVADMNDRATRILFFTKVPFFAGDQNRTSDSFVATLPAHRT